MGEKEIKEAARELMLKAPVLYLASIDENGFPHIRAIENLKSVEKFPHAAKVLSEHDQNDLNVYISTNTSSTKVKQVKKNSAISIYYCLPNEYKGIMLQGKAEFIDDIELKKKLWTDGWEMYYSKGYSDPDFTILRLKPKYLKTWYKSGIDEIVVSD